MSAQTLAALLGRLRGGLVVSCQPVAGGPMDDDDTVVRLARAAVIGGAAGLRIEGARRVAATRAAVGVPLIGLVKRTLPRLGLRITPLIEDIEALAAAGADLIAIDATTRDRPVPLADQFHVAHRAGCAVLADCATEAEALSARDLGAAMLATTLAGYTAGPAPDEPDLALVALLARHGHPVMAEGRFHTPEQVRTAFDAGAWAVTVGTAITRTEVVTAWFAMAAPRAAK